MWRTLLILAAVALAATMWVGCDDGPETTNGVEVKDGELTRVEWWDDKNEFRGYKWFDPQGVLTSTTFIVDSQADMDDAIDNHTAGDSISITDAGPFYLIESGAFSFTKFLCSVTGNVSGGARPELELGKNGESHQALWEATSATNLIVSSLYFSKHADESGYNSLVVGYSSWNLNATLAWLDIEFDGSDRFARSINMKVTVGHSVIDCGPFGDENTSPFNGLHASGIAGFTDPVIVEAMFLDLGSDPCEVAPMKTGGDVVVEDWSEGGDLDNPVAATSYSIDPADPDPTFSNYTLVGFTKNGFACTAEVKFKIDWGAHEGNEDIADISVVYGDDACSGASQTNITKSGDWYHADLLMGPWTDCDFKWKPKVVICSGGDYGSKTKYGSCRSATITGGCVFGCS